eukprot:1765236-Rhodomonas_salina.1
MAHLVRRDQSCFHSPSRCCSPPLTPGSCPHSLPARIDIVVRLSDGKGATKVDIESTCSPSGSVKIRSALLSLFLPRQLLRMRRHPDRPNGFPSRISVRSDLFSSSLIDKTEAARSWMRLCPRFSQEMEQSGDFSASAMAQHGRRSPKPFQLRSNSVKVLFSCSLDENSMAPVARMCAQLQLSDFN